MSPYSVLSMTRSMIDGKAVRSSMSLFRFSSVMPYTTLKFCVRPVEPGTMGFETNSFIQDAAMIYVHLDICLEYLQTCFIVFGVNI